MDESIAAVAIVQMQDLIGPALMCVYPVDFNFETITTMQHYLVEILLPSSANSTNEDTLRIVTREFKSGEVASQSSTRFSLEGGGVSSPKSSATSPLFIAGAFRASREADGCRGTRQASVVICMRQPLFRAAMPFVEVAATKYAHGEIEGPDVCHTLYEAIHTAGSAKSVTIPLLRPEPFPLPYIAPDDSMQKLLRRESDVMFVIKHGAAVVLPVWRAMAQQKSVVIVGDTADHVTRFVIGMVALVTPMKMPLDALYPYIPTPSMVENLDVPFFILGTTNEYFAVKKTMGCVIANVSTSEVWIQPEQEKYITPADADNELMVKVDAGIAEGKAEDWIRLVFERHTAGFLQSLPFLEALLHREELKQFRKMSKQQILMAVFSGIVITVGLIIIISMASLYS